MKNEFNAYVANVIKNIIANNKFSITEVQDIESIKSIYFDKEQFQVIDQLIKERQIDTIKELPENPKSTSEYLDVMIFYDQNNKKYAVTIYDNDNLWQDPQIIEIYCL